MMGLTLSSVTMDPSDGMGFGLGKIEGMRHLNQFERRLQMGQPCMAGEQALAGIKLLADSEIHWNLARPHLERSRSLCQKGMYTEAYDACQKATGFLIRHNGRTYDPGGIIHAECWMIENEHRCMTDSTSPVLRQNDQTNSLLRERDLLPTPHRTPR
jgi:hypothetical protein